MILRRAYQTNVKSQSINISRVAQGRPEWYEKLYENRPALLLPGFSCDTIEAGDVNKEFSRGPGGI